MGRFPSALALLLALSLVAAAPADDDPGMPMSLEDVVRMFVVGKTTDEILEEIERRAPGFDLSDEMLEELRRIELPEALIAAMSLRQAEAERSATIEAAVRAEKLAGDLRVLLNPDSTDAYIRIGKDVDPQLAAEWELGNAPEDRVFAGIAVFLACVSPAHVPGQWRSKTPLGRDFITATRHRMLVFEAAGTAEDASGSAPRLELPEALEARVDPHEPHDLVLGIALQTARRYFHWTHASRNGVVVGDELVTLVATVRGHRLKTLRVEFE